MMHWKSYILGVLTLPLLWVFLQVLGIFLRSLRDTYRTLRGAEMKEGYSKWRWAYLIPLCWWDQLKQQTWSWWNGVRTEVQ